MSINKAIAAQPDTQPTWTLLDTFHSNTTSTIYLYNTVAKPFRKLKLVGVGITTTSTSFLRFRLNSNNAAMYNWSAQVIYGGTAVPFFNGAVGDNYARLQNSTNSQARYLEFEFSNPMVAQPKPFEGKVRYYDGTNYRLEEHQGVIGEYNNITSIEITASAGSITAPTNYGFFLFGAY